MEEEKRGIIRWLRPDYQIPRFAPEGAAKPAAPEPALAIVDAAAKAEGAESRPAWPATAVEQLAAIGALLAARPMTVEQVAASFTGSKRDLVERHLETLALMGEIVPDESGRYGTARKVA